MYSEVKYCEHCGGVKEFISDAIASTTSNIGCYMATGQFVPNLNGNPIHTVIISTAIENSANVTNFCTCKTENLKYGGLSLCKK